MLKRFFAEQAWLSAAAGVAADVTIEATDGVVSTVTTDSAPPPDAQRLPGLVIPGLVNAHSHAFHRALRGRTHAGRGDFWSWREQMYSVVQRLTPQTYLALARAAYAEMALAGITTVVEFHYLHHGPDGVPYDNPAEMGQVLVEAARQAGVGLVLLDTCYLQADVDGTPLAGPQLRFGDGDVDAWARRAQLLESGYGAPDSLGAAVHSVRGCPPQAMREVAAWARGRGAPLHLHLSEQLRENRACLEWHGRTPTQVCADSGMLGPTTTAVHATHLTPDDVSLLGQAATIACFCPTTERDLADGVGPAAKLRDAGCGLSLGSDSHAVVDLFEEARAVELNERLVTQTRGSHTAGELLAAATAGGAASAGKAGVAGGIYVGAEAAFTAVNTTSVRLAGAETDPVAATVFAATAADVTHVVRGGELIVESGRHVELGDVAALLTSAVQAVYASD